jgi:membrane-bound metal-dependent hydrolase YbcI (DUF457 family)
LGHGLAAAAAGWAVARPSVPRRAFVIQTATLAAVGAAPDLDLLINRHGAEVHSIGFGALVAFVAAAMRWPVAASRGRIWLAVFLAWATHPLLDSLASDWSEPYGVMAFWPISRTYLYSGLDLFDSIWRHYWEAGWFTHNVIAVTKEIVYLGPITLLVWWLRRDRRP